jgi:hypothetical protein
MPPHNEAVVGLRHFSQLAEHRTAQSPDPVSHPTQSSSEFCSPSCIGPQGTTTELQFIPGSFSPEALRKELAKYGPGPPPEAEGEARTSWFLSHLRMMNHEHQ